MTLLDIVDRVRQREKTLTLFNLPPGSSLDTRLASFFADQNVRVEVDDTSAEAPCFATLTDPDTLYAAVDASDLLDLLDGPAAGPDDLGIDDSAHAALLAPLKETTFTSYDHENLMQVTREIEDRAFRVGEGTLSAGFQQLSNFDHQTDVYRRLATTDLDLHVFGEPDGHEDVEGVTAHGLDTEEIRKTWFVVFDGGGRDELKSALLAVDRGNGTFFGTWSYDPALVDEVSEYLLAHTDHVTP
ncbi:DICT sensory domain-containing protein [Haloarchaeobius amylolyticus]|uniref:DICT sensory domain-containing protein n=1 Tax=Haloarchaeobius amylolyticus TaxID=1198296 RepID=UPI0022717F04|nr:DICT sensory domain-containing protein [Haloarchaeobius amylolyticus]